MYNVGAGSGNLGAKTGFVYMGSSFVLLLVAFFWIPETKGLSTEELDYLYENGVPPRKFFSTKVETTTTTARDSREKLNVEKDQSDGRQWVKKNTS